MGKIVAIGGGEIGRPGFEIETLEIDKEIIKLSNKINPKLLFIPTASSDHEGYIEVVKNYFGKRLGCIIDVLYLLNNELNFDEIRNKIMNTDIIYVGGGNTQKLLEVWKEKKIDKLLKEAFDKDIIMSGISAGAICWFSAGCSDYVEYKFDSVEKKFTTLNALGIIQGILCPHFDVEKSRENIVQKIVREEAELVIALDNCVAIEIVGNKYRIIRSKQDANAYKIFYKDGIKKECINETEFKDINELLKIK